MAYQRISRFCVVAAVVLATLFGATGAPATAAGGPVVHTPDGALRGTSTGTMSEFLGIPYAAPPVGALRWQPPQPAAHWSGVRAATSFAPHCAQPTTPFGKPSMSENCLYLNVFT